MKNTWKMLAGLAVMSTLMVGCKSTQCRDGACGDKLACSTEACADKCADSCSDKAESSCCGTCSGDKAHGHSHGEAKCCGTCNGEKAKAQ